MSWLILSLHTLWPKYSNSKYISVSANKQQSQETWFSSLKKLFPFFSVLKVKSISCQHCLHNHISWHRGKGRIDSKSKDLINHRAKSNFTSGAKRQRQINQENTKLSKGFLKTTCFSSLEIIIFKICFPISITLSFMIAKLYSNKVWEWMESNFKKQKMALMLFFF